MSSISTQNKRMRWEKYAKKKNYTQTEQHSLMPNDKEMDSRWRQNVEKKHYNNANWIHCRKTKHIARTHFNRLLNIKWKHIHFINSTSLLITLGCAMAFYYISPFGWLLWFYLGTNSSSLWCVSAICSTPFEIEAKKQHTPTCHHFEKWDSDRGCENENKVKWVRILFIFYAACRMNIAHCFSGYNASICWMDWSRKLK